MFRISFIKSVAWGIFKIWVDQEGSQVHKVVFVHIGNRFTREFTEIITFVFHNLKQYLGKYVKPIDRLARRIHNRIHTSVIIHPCFVCEKWCLSFVVSLKHNLHILSFRNWIENEQNFELLKLKQRQYLLSCDFNFFMSFMIKMLKRFSGINFTCTWMILDHRRTGKG